MLSVVHISDCLKPEFTQSLDGFVTSSPYGCIKTEDRQPSGGVA